MLKNDGPTNVRHAPRLRPLSEDRDHAGRLRPAPAAIAVYPMYKGLARLVGMDILDAGGTLDEQVETLKKSWNNYDFFFLHYKYTDSTGEDGNFAGKVEMIETLDAEIPEASAPEVPTC